MSFDKRDYYIDGKRDFSDHSDDETHATSRDTMPRFHESLWVATLLVRLKDEASAMGVDLLGECTLDDLVYFIASVRGRGR